jgi:hypothetical protein
MARKNTLLDLLIISIGELGNIYYMIGAVINLVKGVVQEKKVRFCWMG